MPVCKFLSAAICTLVSSSALSQEFDFILDFTDCTALVGAVDLVDNPIVKTEGDPVQFYCQRLSSNMSCIVIVRGGDPSTQLYEIIVDSPPALAFAAPNGSDFVNLNVSNRGAVLTTRIVDSQILASKMCHGVYATKQEIELMLESTEIDLFLQ